jgi:hypothetical protein
MTGEKKVMCVLCSCCEGIVRRSSAHLDAGPQKAFSLLAAMMSRVRYLILLLVGSVMCAPAHGARLATQLENLTFSLACARQGSR